MPLRPRPRSRRRSARLSASSSRDRVGDRRNLCGPVQALAGEQLDLAVFQPRLHAVAVELHLMDPASRRRRLVAAGSRAAAGRSRAGRRFARRAGFRAAPPRPRAARAISLLLSSAFGFLLLPSSRRLLCGLRRVPFFNVFTFSATDLFDCHTASPAFAISSMRAAGSPPSCGFSSRMSGSLGPRAASSSDLISSQVLLLAAAACACAPDASGP